MFKHSTTKESMEGRVVIKDVSAKVLQLLLAFLYTGLVNLEGDEELTVELLAAADKYEVDSLKAICSEQLAAGLSAQSMFATLHFAEQYSAPELKSKVVDFIANQTSIQEKVKALLDVNDSPEKVIAFLQK
ncbi:PREDICTED: TD and POZ domain-containing protein 4-like, partial [Rhagoletis zephyria]|uniref:TD and POZ domain-containing protein 4-like n=1 Tax=Rhagoletis zephyria TaxID=28612 RepID=UPI00081140E5